MAWFTIKKKKCSVYASFRPSTATSRWLLVKWRHFRVTSGHLRSRDVISCHETAQYCELQPCNKGKCTVYASFRPSTATSRWLPVKWRHFRVTSGHLSHVTSSCHVTASYCELQPCRKWNVQYTQVLSSPAASRWLPAKCHSRVTSDHLKSRDVISCDVTASYCELAPCRKWNVQYTQVLVLPLPLPGDFRWNDVTSESLPVTWCHVMSFPVTWLPLTASL